MDGKVILQGQLRDMDIEIRYGEDNKDAWLKIANEEVSIKDLGYIESTPKEIVKEKLIVIHRSETSVKEDETDWEQVHIRVDTADEEQIRKVKLLLKNLVVASLIVKTMKNEVAQ